MWWSYALRLCLLLPKLNMNFQILSFRHVLVEGIGPRQRRVCKGQGKDKVRCHPIGSPSKSYPHTTPYKYRHLFVDFIFNKLLLSVERKQNNKKSKKKTCRHAERVSGPRRLHLVPMPSFFALSVLARSASSAAGTRAQNRKSQGPPLPLGSPLGFSD
jgi:hypothetical protein